MRFKSNKVEEVEESVSERNIRIRKERERYINWHKHFAWLPVIIKDEVIWLETVERRYPRAGYYTNTSGWTGATEVVWSWDRPHYRMVQQYEQH
jgi:hypothetical protein